MNQLANKSNYNLEDRTAKFGESIIEFCKEMPKNIISNPLINQLIRSGTSVGANYAEANGASSKQDFKNKIFICKKELNETKYWLRMMSKTDANMTEKPSFMERSSRINLNIPKNIKLIKKVIKN